MPSLCKNVVMLVSYGCQVMNYSSAGFLKSFPTLFSSYVRRPYVNLAGYACVEGQLGAILFYSNQSFE